MQPPLIQQHELILRIHHFLHNRPIFRAEARNETHYSWKDETQRGGGRMAMLLPLDHVVDPQALKVRIFMH
jgi:hypothetical protein